MLSFFLHLDALLFENCLINLAYDLFLALRVETLLLHGVCHLVCDLWQVFMLAIRLIIYVLLESCRRHWWFAFLANLFNFGVVWVFDVVYQALFTNHLMRRLLHFLWQEGLPVVPPWRNCRLHV